MPLVAHLRHHPVLARRQHQLARFPDGVRQRLLAINMLAQGHRHHCRRAVLMVGNGHAHGVQRLFLVQHFPVILVSLGRRQFVFPKRQTVRIHVAQGHDVLLRNSLRVRVGQPGHILPSPPAHHADAPNVQLLIGGFQLDARVGGREPRRQGPRRQRRGVNEPPPVDAQGCHRGSNRGEGRWILEISIWHSTPFVAPIPRSIKRDLHSASPGAFSDSLVSPACESKP